MKIVLDTIRFHRYFFDYGFSKDSNENEIIFSN